MAENDARLGERTRQMITARKNRLRNQATEQESPERAKPKAKSEPRPTSIVEKLTVVGDETSETTHEPKGKGEGHRIIRSFKKKYQEGDVDQTRPIFKKTTPKTIPHT